MVNAELSPVSLGAECRRERRAGERGERAATRNGVKRPERKWHAKYNKRDSCVACELRGAYVYAMGREKTRVHGVPVTRENDVAARRRLLLCSRQK